MKDRPLSDTLPEAREVLVRLLREAPPWRKLRMVSQITVAVRSLAESGVRARHPLADEGEIRRRLADILLGGDLARRAYGPGPDERKGSETAQGGSS